MEGVYEMSWSYFDATMVTEELELMAQLLGPCQFASDQDHELNLGFIPSLFWSDQESDSFYSSQDANSSSCYRPQENNCTSFSTDSFFAPHSVYQEYCMSESNLVSTVSNNHEQMILNMAACLNEKTSSDDAGDSGVNSSEHVVVLDQRAPHKRKFSMDEVDKPIEHDNKLDIATDIPKKKVKVSSQVQKMAKNTKSKKTDHEEISARGEEEKNNAAAINVQSSSSCSSEDNSKGKARASRGSATDPQSLYARKRRERINERLRILQNLVPNGTKVDISTMLEEAVQYVKFLQLQIKLLSSDELWMYAPLAYNGMDIGLDLKISLPRQ